MSLASILLCLVIALTVVTVSHAYPTGAPEEVCSQTGSNAQQPGHGGSFQTTAFPFNFTASATSWTAGKPLNITITKTGQTSMTGFMLSAFATSDSGYSGPRYGVFESYNNDANQVCDDGTGVSRALTHQSGASKSVLKTKFTTPDRGTGSLTFLLTVVTPTRTIYWRTSLTLPEVLAPVSSSSSSTGKSSSSSSSSSGKSSSSSSSSAHSSSSSSSSSSAAASSSSLSTAASSSAASSSTAASSTAQSSTAVSSSSTAASSTADSSSTAASSTAAQSSTVDSSSSAASSSSSGSSTGTGSALGGSSSSSSTGAGQLSSASSMSVSIVSLLVSSLVTLTVYTLTQ